MNKTKFLWVICLVLVAVTIFFGARYFQEKREAERMQNLISSYEKKDNVLAFTDLFVEEVLLSKKEIDFETRLRLENSVRGLDNKKIQDAWQLFVDSPNEAEAQKNVENLLTLLVKEIMVKE